MTASAVSVVIPSYNHAHFLPGAIESALGQIGADVRVVVVDDGSTDDTSELASRYPERVTWLRQEHRGLPAARNTGLSRAEGEYVVFLDADDALAADAVARKIALLERDATLGWIFSDLYITDANGAVVGRCSEQFHYGSRCRDGMIFSDLLRGNFIPVHAVLVRRACLDNVGSFDESLTRGAEDWDLWLRVACRFPVAYLDAPLGYYRRPLGSMTSDRFAMALANLDVMARVEARWPAEVARSRRTWQRQKATQYLRAAIDLRTSVGRRASLGWIWRAVRTRPVQGAAYRVLLCTLFGSRPPRRRVR